MERASQRLASFMRGEPQELKDVRDQTEEDKQLVSFVKSKLEESRTWGARVAQEGINLTNIAYLCGFDSVYFDSTARAFKPIASPSRLIRSNRVHVNRILPTVQNRLARLTKSPPRWDVPPNSSDEEDKDAARLSVQVLEQLWEQVQINRKRLPLTMWLQQCGVGYLKVCWDSTLGPKRVVPREPKPGEETQEGGAKLYDIVAEGDVRVDVCSFFEIFPDPLAKNWDELRWVIHAKIRPLEYFQHQYPERGQLVKEEDCWLQSLVYEQRINTINTTTGAGAMAGNMKNSAVEISYYEKPSQKHPYGRHIITANGAKLKDDVLPIDELPIVKFDDVIVGGKFNSEAIITHLRPLQDQINRGKSMRAAWLNRTLTGKYAVARGANLAREALNDQSGEVLEYDAIPGVPEGGKPQVLDTPSIPQYAYQEEDTLKLDMDDTAGVNQASRGQMPSAQIPAIGMQLLVEQDDTRIGVETESHEHSYADLGRILLKFVDEYYVTERLLKVVGKNQEYLVRKFKGTDLRENFDVRVVRGSTLPGSKVLKRQEIINMWQQGLFGNPTDPLVVQNVLSWLEYGDVYQSWKRHSLRMAQIQRGIRMIEDTHEKPPVSEFDDHALWIQELDDYRISDKFLKLDDEQKRHVLDCMNEHANFLQEMAAPIPDPDTDPGLKPTTAAQENEEQVMNEQPPPEPAPEGPPVPIDMEAQAAAAEGAQLEQ